jgi:site-specific DNA recombinase
MMTTKPLDAYIRVSRRLGRKGPGYISPRVQREAIERWAEYRGVQIAAWHLDEDESGGTHDRPGLDAARDRALAGETGGIVSWKIDRFSRFTEGGLRDLRLLEQAGARLAFVAEDVDTSGPMGKLVYTMLLAFSEFFLDNIKAGWTTAKTRAIDRGAHIGPTPYGYQRNEDGTLSVDPAHARVVTEAFNVCSTTGIHAAIDYLREQAPERTWVLHTARRFLSQRVYLGEVGYGDQRRAAAHDALVDRATFDRARHQLGDGKRTRRPKQDFPLSGVGACGTCGAPLVGGRGGPDARRMYRCSARCDKPVATSAESLEQHVVQWLRDRFQHPGMRVGGDAPDVREAETTLAGAENELDVFASDLDARRLLGDRYHHHLEQRVQAVESASARLQEILDAAEGTTVIVPSELWDDLEAVELGDVLRSTLVRVVVDRGRGALAGRVHVVAKGMDGTAGAGTQDTDEGVL